LIHDGEGETTARDLDLDEAEAERAHTVISDGFVEETEMASLPEGWGETLTGEPMPNVGAAVRPLPSVLHEVSFRGEISNALAELALHAFIVTPAELS